MESGWPNDAQNHRVKLTIVCVSSANFFLLADHAAGAENSEAQKECILRESTYSLPHPLTSYNVQWPASSSLFSSSFAHLDPCLQHPNKYLVFHYYENATSCNTQNNPGYAVVVCTADVCRKIPGQMSWEILRIQGIEGITLNGALTKNVVWDDGPWRLVF